ncbi:hypothetical protein Hanom_Chr05g00402691 [Helianthus anomalus]
MKSHWKLLRIFKQFFLQSCGAFNNEESMKILEEAETMIVFSWVALFVITASSV